MKLRLPKLVWSSLWKTYCRNHKKGGQDYFCRCECGENVVSKAGNLGSTKSCGCYRKEKVYNSWTENHPLYDRCRKMIYRCYDENNESFQIMVEESNQIQSMSKNLGEMI